MNTCNELVPVDDESVGMNFGRIVIKLDPVEATTLRISGDLEARRSEGCFYPSSDSSWYILVPGREVENLPETAGHSLSSWACYTARQLLFGAVVVTQKTLPEYIEAVDKAVMKGIREYPGPFRNIFELRVALENPDDAFES